MQITAAQLRERANDGRNDSLTAAQWNLEAHLLEARGGTADLWEWVRESHEVLRWLYCEPETP